MTRDGYKYILVVTDLFTKWVEAFPLCSTDSQTLATVLVDEVICRYGVPRSIHSDQEANLTSEIVKHMCEVLGMERTQTTAYHAQGNGLVERMNRTLKTMLAKVVRENQTDWNTKVLFAYRTTIQDSTSFTPFHIMFGRSPSLPIDRMLALTEEGKDQSYSEYVKKLKQSLEDAYQIVRTTMKASHNQQKRQYDKGSREFQLRIGDMVYLHVPAVRQGRNRKLASQWTGPYTITDRVSKYNVRLQLVGVLNS